MKKFYKLAVVFLTAALVLDFVSCKMDVETEYVEVLKEDGFVKIPKGSFKRSTASKSSDATESNTYTITLTKDFYMCDHEVTQGEWEKYMTYFGEVDSSSQYKPSNTYGKGENYPVYYINWYEAVTYCNLLSKAKGLTPVYYITVEEEKKNRPCRLAQL